MSEPAVAVVPPASELEEAVRAGGGRIVDPAEADALIWSTPRKPEELKRILASSPARWVALPFAGIERFFDAGVIDPDRTWTCAKGVYGPATAEGALALMLAAARRIHVHVRARAWERDGQTHQRLAGATVLIIGTGGIGRALARMLEPLGARILAANRGGAPMPEAERTVAVDRLDEVLPESDWVVVAAAHTPETTALIDARRLKLMKPTAWLVNVARGPIVDTDALVSALQAGEIAGAALDVTDPEPLPDGHPLWEMDNVIITPHVANTWAMALPELQAQIRRNVAAFARGEQLEGLVDPALGY